MIAARSSPTIKVPDDWSPATRRTKETGTTKQLELLCVLSVFVASSTFFVNQALIAH